MQTDRTHNVNKKNMVIFLVTQWAIPCSKLITETLEQGVKYVQSSLLLIFNMFHALF